MRRVAAWAVLLAVLGCLATPSSVIAKGITLGDVPPDGELDRLGFEKGDVIHQVGGNEVETTEELTAWAQTAKDSGAQWLTFTVERQGACWFLNSSYNGQRAYQYGPLKTAPASACGMAEPPVRVAATTGSGIVEPRLGMEFAPLPGGKDGAIFVRSWNTLPLSDGTRPTAKPGDRLSQIISYLVDPPNPDEPFENIAAVRGPQYVPIILDSILRSGKARHDLVTLVFKDSGAVVPVRLLPADSPVPAAPPVAAATPAPVTTSDVTRPASSTSTRLAVPSIGVELVTLQNRYGGVTIGQVIKGSRADHALLVAGDRIMEVNGQPVATALQASREIEQAVQGSGSSLRLSLVGEGDDLRHIDIPLRKVTAPSSSTAILTLMMTAILALVLVAFAVARRKGWGRGFAFLPVRAAPAGLAPPVPGAHDPDDEEEREIALARQAVETAERSPIQGPAPSETGGPSWFQQQRERREVERAKRSMEEAERAAAREPAPHGHYPYPPPPYGYYQRTPFSEKLRVAYWGLKIALVLVVAVWAWSVTGTVVSMLGAIVPAPLRAVTVDLLAKAQDAISKADQGEP